LYDEGFGAPYCREIGNVCNSLGLLTGVGQSEVNSPNTIDECSDYSIGVHRQDESIEQMVVRSVSGKELAVGLEVEVIAIVYTASNTSGRDEPNEKDMGFFFYTSNAHDINWKFVEAFALDTGTGVKEVRTRLVLQPGSAVQAIRLTFGYAEYAIHPCYRRRYWQDIDDLVFAVDHSMIAEPSSRPSVSRLPSIHPTLPIPPTISPSFSPSIHETVSPSQSPSWVADRPPSSKPTVSPVPSNKPFNNGITRSHPTSDTSYAHYDVGVGAPRCRVPSALCDSGSLLTGAANVTLGGTEENFPNTIDDCFDGDILLKSDGTGHYVGSVDRIALRTVDETPMTFGKEVEIEVTIFMPEAYNDRMVDFYYTNDATVANRTYLAAGEWVYLQSLKPQSKGDNVLTVRHSIEAGNSLQAVRVIYRNSLYDASPCASSIMYSDIDDLLFSVYRVGGGHSPQMATFDSTLKVPKCTDTDSSICDSGYLLDGIGNSTGGELNSPNALNGCYDANVSIYHANMFSVDRVVISSVDGGRLMTDTNATIETTLWIVPLPDAYVYLYGFTSVDVWYVPNISWSNWTLVMTMTPKSGGVETFTTPQFTLEAGDVQAVKVIMRYTNSPYVLPNVCSVPPFHTDNDDLVFAVTPFRHETQSPTMAPILLSTPIPSVNPSTSPVSTPLPTSIPSLESSNEVTPLPPITTTLAPQPEPAPFIQNLTAAFDSTMGAPHCYLVGSSCSSDILLRGVGSHGEGGPEPNSPNTIGSCRVEEPNNSKPSSVFHQDESIDQITIRTVSGDFFTIGSEVEVEIALWSAQDTSQRTNPHKWSVAHVYYASNVGDDGAVVDWEYVWSEVVEPGQEEHVFIVRFDLVMEDEKFNQAPRGSDTITQAIRVNYAYAQYTPLQCYDENGEDVEYVDVDDLMFEVSLLNDGMPSTMPSWSYAPRLPSSGSSSLHRGYCVAVFVAAVSMLIL